jgi:bifunctional non-homologous end joining protein LigD
MPRHAQPEVKFTNLEKVLFPATGFTKGQVIDYYVAAAPFILPHLRGRPISLVRFPDGVAGEKFYAKNAPKFTPAWVRTVAVPRTRHSGKIEYIVVDDADTLAWCANLAAIELHPFLHRAPRLDRPTHIVFDLDPGEGADLLDCTEVAFHVKAIADTLGLTVLPKVSGSKGLQLYVPLNTAATYAATAAFAKAVAQLLEQEHPDLVVSRMAKTERRSRVLIDWSQNHAAKTTVAVYSMRGKRETPFISTPVTWAELKRLRRPETLSFDPKGALRRLKKRGDLFAPLLALKQELPSHFTGARAGKAPAALAAYSAKRDFSRTREPTPATTTTPATGKPRFVVQKHAASRLHYDLRLEMDGTLKSWAVPKGLPRELHVKRSAFAVEDHPLGYLDFEGTIPKGQYGGGTVMVWDIGTYELLGGAYDDGNLKVRFAGKKLRGDWHLFKICSEDGKDVWLVAKSGAAAPPITATQDDTSVLTARSMAQIAADNDAVWDSRAG